MFRVILFGTLSAALVYVSRASLKIPRSHGFYRFFAWGVHSRPLFPELHQPPAVVRQPVLFPHPNSHPSTKAEDEHPGAERNQNRSNASAFESVQGTYQSACGRGSQALYTDTHDMSRGRSATPSSPR